MNTLRHFDVGEVFLTDEQASRVFRYFFPDQPISPSSLTSSDKAFAQALLLEAIDASNKMGYVHVLFDKAYMRPPVDFSMVEDIATALAKRTLTNWLKHASGADVSNPQIYEAVRRDIAVQFRSVWAIRLQTDELDY